MAVATIQERPPGGVSEAPQSSSASSTWDPTHQGIGELEVRVSGGDEHDGGTTGDGCGESSPSGAEDRLLTTIAAD